MQNFNDLLTQRDAAPVIRSREFTASRKRGPGRNRRDSPHTGKRKRLTLRARLSKRIRRRRAAVRRVTQAPVALRAAATASRGAADAVAGLVEALRPAGRSPVVRR